MILKLQKREKILLQVLAMVIVCGLMTAYWIIPQFQALSTNRKTLESLETRKIETEQIIAGEKIAREEIASLQEQANMLYRLMGQTQSYDVSLLLSEQLGRHGLTPLSLEISPYTQAKTPEAHPDDKTELQEARYPELDEVLAPTQEAEQQTPLAETEEERQLMSEFVLTRTATLSFSGVRENADRFLDEITNYNRSVVVEGYTVQTYETTQTYELRLSIYEFVEPGALAQTSADATAAQPLKGGE